LLVPIFIGRQEKDPETGWEAFELRIACPAVSRNLGETSGYDGRVGRWMTTDPYSQYHSPYLAMGNNPVKMIDPDGGFASSPLDDYIYDINTGVLHKFETDSPDMFYTGIVMGGEYTTLSEGVELSHGSYFDFFVGDNIKFEGLIVSDEYRMDALKIMYTISFETNIELSAFGVDAGEFQALIVLPWTENDATNSVNSFEKAYSSSTKNKTWVDGRISPSVGKLYFHEKEFGTVKYHIHTQPGTHDNAHKASFPDYKFHNFYNGLINTYIISREGVTKYNGRTYDSKSGSHNETINNFILNKNYWGL
jgi:hypothetical protein